MGTAGNEGVNTPTPDHIISRAAGLQLLRPLLALIADDYAPAQHKARWFATFYLCIPVGFAAGYIFGGVVASALGWRAAFFIESAVMVPFVAFAFLSQPLHLAGSKETGPGWCGRM